MSRAQPSLRAPRRVGILTGGGDCPGLNAVIRGVTKSLLLQGVEEVIGFEDGYLGLIEQRQRRLTWRDVSGILTWGGTMLGASNRDNPFRFAGRGGADVSDAVVDYCGRLGLEALVAIGGDGTLSIAEALGRKGLPLIGVPKTIDNDIVGTDRTFGFDTAVSVAAEALDRLHSTAQSHHRIMILETMGRYAGWIALHAGLASGADVILIPELEYDLEEVARVCRSREEGGQRFTILVVAEGARPAGGELTVRAYDSSRTDPVRLGGVAHVLETCLGERVSSEIRSTILGYLQRGGRPTPYDRVLATAFGSYAAQMVVGRRFGCMVGLQGRDLVEVPLAEVANQSRRVAMDSPALRTAIAVGTSFGVPGLTRDPPHS